MNKLGIFIFTATMAKDDVDVAYLAQLQGFLDGACKSFFAALKTGGSVSCILTCVLRAAVPSVVLSFN